MAHLRGANEAGAQRPKEPWTSSVTNQAVDQMTALR
jgi:hypothetical protein